MESQPQNPEFRNNPENFQPCTQRSCLQNFLTPDPNTFIQTNSKTHLPKYLSCLSIAEPKHEILVLITSGLIQASLSKIQGLFKDL